MKGTRLKPFEKLSRIRHRAFVDLQSLTPSRRIYEVALKYSRSLRDDPLRKGSVNPAKRPRKVFTGVDLICQIMTSHMSNTVRCYNVEQIEHQSDNSVANPVCGQLVSRDRFGYSFCGIFQHFSPGT